LARRHPEKSGRDQAMPVDESTESVQQCEQFSKEARKKARDMDCDELLEKINELTSCERQGRSGTKGLEQRFRDYLGDDATHGPAIENQQRGLRTYIDEYVSRGCGDPPSKAYEFANKPLPTPVPAPDNSKKAGAAVKAGAVVGLGYITYRVIRMLPSLLPPLWETIPVNLAIP